MYDVEVKWFVFFCFYHNGLYSMHNFPHKLKISLYHLHYLLFATDKDIWKEDRKRRVPKRSRLSI